MAGPLPEPTSVDQPYWDAARAGRLRLQRCDNCDQVLFPPARACPQCLSRSLMWIDLSGRGTVWSWVVFHRQYFPEMPPPYTVVRVRLDEGPCLLLNLVEPGDLAIDAPVEVVFEPADGLVLPQCRLMN